MAYAEDDLLPISALQHMLFCERQCALIHVERVWEENIFTAQGTVLHKKAHEGKPETRDGERITRGLPLRSLKLGLTGVADIVLYRPPDGAKPTARTFANSLRRATPEELSQWSITPIEYKRGRPKKNDSDRVQLCAQAICLEEMHNVAVPEGQIYYGQQRRRTDVLFDKRLRDVTRRTAERFREIIVGGITPPAVKEKKCDTCSLLSHCLPAAVEQRSVQEFFKRQIDRLLAEN